MEYPEKLYIVWHNGCIEENTLVLPESGKPDDRGRRSYRIRVITGLTEYDGFGNREFTLRQDEGRTGLNGCHEFSIEYIEKCLKGDHDTFWTTDVHEAVKTAEKRFRETWPAGRIWKVVTYFDDCGEYLYKDGLSNREAEILKDELVNKNRNRLYWSCSVKHD